MNNKIALVTGAGGCVGRAVCVALLADTRSHWIVYGVGRGASSASRFAAGVMNGHGVDFKNEKVDAVFHCAGNTSHDVSDKKAQWDDNVKFTADVVKWCGGVQKDTKLIFTSTGASYLFHDEGNTANHYAMSKAVAEWIVVSHPNSVVLQPCVILGPGDTRNYIKLFRMAAAGVLAHAFPGSIEFGYVKDIADAHVNAYYDGVAGDSYMLGGVHATWKEFFQTINDVVGSEVKVKEMSRWFSRLLVWGKNKWGNTDITPPLLNLLMRYSKVPTMEMIKSRDDIGYTPSVTLREMCDITWKSVTQ